MTSAHPVYPRQPATSTRAHGALSAVEAAQRWQTRMTCPCIRTSGWPGPAAHWMGLSVGDALGQHWLVYMLRGGSLAGMLPQLDLPPPPWYFTDDTTMALSVVAVLRQARQIQQEQLVADFALRFQQDPFRGYGAGMQSLLRQINAGHSWREASKSQFPNQAGSEGTE